MCDRLDARFVKEGLWMEKWFSDGVVTRAARATCRSDHVRTRACGEEGRVTRIGVLRGLVAFLLLRLSVEGDLQTRSQSRSP